MSLLRAACIVATMCAAVTLRAQSRADVAGTYAIWDCDTMCTTNAPASGFLVLSRTPLDPEQFPARFRRGLQNSGGYIVQPGEVTNACGYWTATSRVRRASSSYLLNTWNVRDNDVTVKIYAGVDASTTLKARVRGDSLSGSVTATDMMDSWATRVTGRRISDVDILKCTPEITPADTAKTGRLSAVDVVERIRQHAGVTLPARTVDTFKAGDPAAPVKGIAVTMMPTLDVLRRAAARGANLIIAHEPTFYTSLDTASALTQEGDEILAAKRMFIAQHGLVIFRFHDTPHAMKPDMINTGIARAVGWENNTHNGNPVVFDIRATTLSSLASYVSGKLGAKATRIAGDPNARISRVSFTQGFVGFTANRRAFQNNNVDAIIIGEDHEWETIEYAVDAITAGKLKGLIVIGHVPSEQAGMEEVTRWLKTFITEVPIEFIPTGDLLTRAPQTPATR